MIGIVDYGAGNLRNVQAAVERLGIPWKSVTRPADLRDASRLILPGVGRFAAAAARLREADLWDPLRAFARSGRPLLGICLGMQLLFEGSDEDPGVPGLAIIQGRARRLRTKRLPHIGWATVEPLAPRAGPLFEGLPPRFDAYFAHSFAVPEGCASAAALTLHPSPFAAAVGWGATWGVQFHPEKSSGRGQDIIARFARLEPAPGPDAPRSAGARAGEAAGAASGDARRPDRMRRVIPCLDIQGGRVVKGIRFRDLRDAGDPVERAEAYDRDGADEVCLLDVSASREERRPLLDLVERVAARLTVPLSFGGGVRSVGEMRALLLAGADRVSIGTAAYRDPGLIGRAASAFGSQFVIVSVDARRAGGGWEVTTHGGSRGTGRDAVEWAREAARLGAGEILLNAMDADGTRGGYDTALTRAVARTVNVPVIASGGAGTPLDMACVLTEGEADAALAASIFHDGSLGIRQAKEALRATGIRVRL